jgi:hypothetical protein
MGSFLAAILVSSLAAAASGLAPLGLPLPTTPRDFLQPGTQPETLTDPIFASTNCRDCHGNYDLTMEPYGRWAGSMMAQATRDPVFHACLAVANQDVAGAGELCLRCHAPVGWLGGRSTPPDGSGLDKSKGDFDGVTCHVCHRFVDPVYDPDANPVEDADILAGLAHAPDSESHTGQYVLDPKDRRRGPFDLGHGFPWHNWLQSPYHREAMLCANCHDVSNPTLSRQTDGTYKLNALDAPHPTHRKKDEFPVERTFTEWKHSVYGRAEIDVAGRFGGNKPAVSTCQDCHLSDATGVACKPGVGGVLRDDLPLHDFNGANSWVVKAVRALYPDEETGLTDDIVADALGRNQSMLERAADLEAFRRGNDLVVRVINRGGHKLPTGYGEGRRMWLNVQFLDAGGQLLQERGHYDPVTADLTTRDTRVYEMHQGLDAYMAGVTGLPVGESFHFLLNNTILKDNRVPPRGFTNAVYEGAQAGVVGYAYPDEHFWDDAVFPVPPGTAKVVVSLYHQTTTREYIEFLRDENHTNDKGQVAYDVWAQMGKSAPTLMASVELAPQAPVCPQPIVYGLGKVGSNGLRARLAWTGTPSVSGNDFEVNLSDALPGRPGMLIVGTRSASRPFSGGTLLVDEPLVLDRFTVEADGTAAIHVPLGGRPGLVGKEIYFQALFSDPSDGGPASLSSMSDGLHVDVCE